MNEPHDPNQTASIVPAAGPGRTRPSTLGSWPPIRSTPAWPQRSASSGRRARAWATCGRCCSRRPRARAPTSSSRSPTPCRPRARPATATSSPARSPAAAWAPCCAAATSTWAATWPSRCCWRSTPNRPEVARRFVEEAQIGGQLQHPGVVPVYDIGRFGDRPFFTMKLVKGQTLAAHAGRTDRARRPTGRACWASPCRCAQALAYAHAKGVIHRDLKPANVMVGAFGEVQVMDWGLAKVLAEGGDRRRGAGQPAHQRRRTDARSAPPAAAARRAARHGHGGGLAAGHAGVHAAGAGQRRRGPPRPPGRRVRPGRHPVRDPDGQAALRRAGPARKCAARRPTATWPTRRRGWTAAGRTRN